MAIHVAILYFFGIITAAFISFIFFGMAIIEKRWWGLPLGILFAVLTAFNIGWVIYASSFELEIEYIEEYEIKNVTFPDGKKVQMYTIKGEIKNANAQFGRQFSEGDKVKRIVYKHIYYGVAFDKKEDYVVLEE